MGLALKKTQAKYTYKDYYSWNDNERYELINGEVYNMSPAPMRRRQKVSGKIYTIFSLFLKNKKREVYSAPFDVRLPNTESTRDEDIDTVVQPNISIICDKNKLDDRGCIGAPDLIIEILSPFTSNKDLKQKYSLYEKHGVKEYWVVYLYEKIIMLFLLGKDGSYQKPISFGIDDKIKVGIFNNKLSVDLNEVFEED